MFIMLGLCLKVMVKIKGINVVPFVDTVKMKGKPEEVFMLLSIASFMNWPIYVPV